MKDVNSHSYTSVDNELATYGVSSIDGCNEHDCGSSSREEEMDYEHDLEPIKSFPEAHTAYETVK